MKICGVELSGIEATLAVVNVTKTATKFVKTDNFLFTLDKDEKIDNVKKFYDSIKNFIKENKVTHLAIKKRNKKGQYAGGAITFKMEGLFQMVDKVEVELLAPQSISATNKKNNFKIDKDMDTLQKTAYLAACTLGTKI